MITYQHLRFKGTTTYPDWVDVELDNQGITVIYGDNEVGKSTIFNVIANILFGTTPIGFKNKTKQLATGDYEAFLDLKIKDTHWTFGQQFTSKVSRYIIKKNGKQIDVGGIPASKKFIADVFPLTEDEFYSFVYLSQNKFHVLARGLPAERAAFFSNVFRLYEYDLLREKLSKIRKQYQDKFADLDRYLVELNSLRGEIDNTDLAKLEQVDDMEQKLLKVNAKNRELTKKLKKLYALLERAKARSSIEKKVSLYEGVISEERLEKLKNKLTVTREQNDLLQKRSDIEKQKEQYAKYAKFDRESLSADLAEIDKLLHLQERFDSLSKKIEEQRQQLLGFDISKLPIIKKRLSKITMRVASLKQEIKVVNKLKGKSRCPTCKQPLAIKEDYLEKCSKKLQSYLQLQTNLKSKMEQLEKESALIQTISLLEKELPSITKRVVPSDRERLTKSIEGVIKLDHLEQTLAVLGAPKIKTKQDTHSLEKTIKELEYILPLYKQLKELPELDQEKIQSKIDVVENKIVKNEDVAKKLIEDLSVLKERVKVIRNKQEKIRELENKVADAPKIKQQLKILEALDKAYGPKGIKLDMMKELARLLTKALNIYSKLVFSSPIKFVVDDKLNILYDRGNGQHDVRFLSGGGIRRFMLALIPAISSMVEASKKSNIIILDEVTANIDNKGIEMFASDFLPFMQTKYSSVFAITPYSPVNFNIKDAKYINIRSVNNISKLARKEIK